MTILLDRGVGVAVELVTLFASTQIVGSVPAHFDLSLRSISNSGWARRWIRRQLAFGSLCLLALTAQFFHAGTDHREIVGSTRLDHWFLPFA
jgi:hypothetical protein